MLPAGCDEMIIDCFRSAKDSSASDVYRNGGEVLPGDGGRPLNFDDGWEADFVPDYKMVRSSSGSNSSSSAATIAGPGGARIEVLKKAMPEYTVKQGRASSIEIEQPHWTPRIDANIPPWETIW